ncbi:MAG: M28 family peptidase [bacterium]
MHACRFRTVTALILATAIPSLIAAQTGKLNHYGNPARVAPAPTAAAITARDLQIRLYQFADDSMLGRQVGRVGNYKGTAYIASEVKRLGLLPAGDNGTYFQVLPFHVKKFTDHSRMTVDGNPLAWEKDFVAVPGARAPRAITEVSVIFGGVTGDTTRQISAAQAAGKFVVLLPALPGQANGGGRAGRGGRGGGGGGGGAGRGAAPVNRFADAVAVATVDLDALSPTARAAINIPIVASQNAGGGGRGRGGANGAPVDSLALLKQQVAALAPSAVVHVTRETAARMFHRQTIDALNPGAQGGIVSASLDYVELPSEWARNVVAIIPGSDPVLKNEYVAIGAHNDHIGIRNGPVDKDSLKAFNDVKNRMLLAKDMLALTEEELGTIRVNMDSIRKIFPKARVDSINNGADDDGSGSMGVLEIAEAIQSMKVKPKRSVLFVWHTGEEAGLVGSSYFTHNPTVPMDSVVTQINIDMIGRGRVGDIPGGGSDYLGVVGSFFDSKDLGDEVQAVNKKQAKPFKLDYRYDSTLTWSGYNNIYGRSDHFNYALQGVPIAFFWTGLHGDYHQASDEPEFIDYPHYASIANYLKELTVDVANGPRPRMNGSKPARPPRPLTP